MRVRAAFLVSALGLLLVPVLALACPTCKDALAENPEGHGFAVGIYYTVVLLLGVFFSMVGLIVYKIVREARQPGPSPKAGQAPSA